MQNILEQIEEWIKEFLIDCITGNLTGMFDEVNSKVGEIATEVGKTPKSKNSSPTSILSSCSVKSPMMVLKSIAVLPWITVAL